MAKQRTKRPTASDLRVLERVNNAVVTAEDLATLVEEVNRRAAENPDLAGDMLGAFTAMALFNDKSVPVHQTADKVHAVWSRMEALGLLLKDGMPEFALRGASGDHWMVDDAVLAAAAVHPLVMRDGRMAFERDSFVRRALALADPKTQA